MLHSTLIYNTTSDIIRKKKLFFVFNYIDYKFNTKFCSPNIVSTFI